MRSGEASPSTSSITSAVVPPDSLQAVDRGDVRMIQRGERLRLRAGSAPGARRRRRTTSGSTLIATCALQVRVGGAIHLAHAAHADLGGDFVRAEARAWCQGQSGCGLYGRE